MPTRIGRVALSGLVAALAYLEEADAHEVVGNRFFPATLTIDDPGVNDELAIPTVSLQRSSTLRATIRSSSPRTLQSGSERPQNDI